jgi:hypothetical protein
MSMAATSWALDFADNHTLEQVRAEIIKLEGFQTRPIHNYEFDDIRSRSMNNTRLRVLKARLAGDYNENTLY